MISFFLTKVGIELLRECLTKPKLLPQYDRSTYPMQVRSADEITPRSQPLSSAELARVYSWRFAGTLFEEKYTLKNSMNSSFKSGQNRIHNLSSLSSLQVLFVDDITGR